MLRNTESVEQSYK